MFTTDTTTRCPLISVYGSGKSSCSNDRSLCVVYGKQSERLSLAVLHGKPSVDANSVCCIYVGGVTIWLVRLRAAALVTRCVDKNKNIRCSEVRWMTFADCLESHERHRLD